MKLLITFFCLLSFQFSFSQTTKTNYQDTSYANFIAIIDTNRATKDGIYLNGYVVNIKWKEFRKLHGKKVSVSGKITIEKAYNKEDSPYISQGRERDTKHIEKPKISLLN